MKQTKRRSQTQRATVPQGRKKKIPSQAPAASAQSFKGSAPIFKSNGGRTITISHEEFFFVQPSSENFVTYRFIVNPGLTGLFPWLSPIALRYEFYRFHKLIFHYRTRCPSITPGSSAAVFDFDVLDPSPADLLEAMSAIDHTADSVWKDQTLRVNLAACPGNKYTRAGFPASGGFDERNYDLGNLFIMAEGTAGTSVSIGLWSVEYSVELTNPQTQDLIGGSFYNDQASAERLFISSFTGSNHATDHSRVPFQVIDNGRSIKFLERYEGLLNMLAHGALDSGLQPVTAEATITGSGSVVSPVMNLVHSVFDASFQIAIKAMKDAVLTVLVKSLAPIIVDWTQYRISSAAFDQLYSPLSLAGSGPVKDSLVRETCPEEAPSRASSTFAVRNDKGRR